MPFTGNLPNQGTNPWYTPFKAVWDQLVAFVNGLETDIANIELIPGPPGTNATITDATAVGLPAGASPTVTMGGTASARTFEFGIPKGDKGDPGTGGGGAVTSVNTKTGDVVIGVADLAGLQGTLDSKATITYVDSQLATKASAADLDNTFGIATSAQADATSALTGLTAKANTSDVVPNTRTVAGKALSANVTLVKGDVGLPNVDNTSDANKPVSTAQQTALNAKADDNAVVKLTGDQTVAGIKTFTGIPVVPVGSWPVNRTSGLQGLLDAKVPTTRQVGGYALSADAPRAALNVRGLGDAIFIPTGGTVPGGTPAYTIVVEV